MMMMMSAQNFHVYSFIDAKRSDGGIRKLWHIVGQSPGRPRPVLERHNMIPETRCCHAPPPAGAAVAEQRVSGGLAELCAFADICSSLVGGVDAVSEETAETWISAKDQGSKRLFEAAGPVAPKRHCGQAGNEGYQQFQSCAAPASTLTPAPAPTGLLSIAAHRTTKQELNPTREHSAPRREHSVTNHQVMSFDTAKRLLVAQTASYAVRPYRLLESAR